MSTAHCNHLTNSRGPPIAPAGTSVAMPAAEVIPMHRNLFLSMALLALGSCAAQAICPPWAPATPTTPPTTADGAAAAPATTDDDGTVALAGPDADDTWTSVVGVKVANAVAVEPTDHDHARGASGARNPAPTRKPRGAAATTPAPTVQPVATTAPAAATAAQPVRGPDPLAKEARAFFAARCVPCHGESGRGDGPTGKVIDPHPRNFTDRAWQASVTDAHIEKVILEGGPSVGKSPLMPAHGDLGSNRALLAAMRGVVRDFGH